MYLRIFAYKLLKSNQVKQFTSIVHLIVTLLHSELILELFKNRQNPSTATNVNGLGAHSTTASSKGKWNVVLIE